jgi:hypothetical protein
MIKHTPQFDVDNITLGSAYWLTKSSATILNGHLDAPAIIVRVEPFNITFTFYNENLNKIDTIALNILDIVNNVYYLTPMVKELIPKETGFLPCNAEDKEGF